MPFLSACFTCIVMVQAAAAPPPPKAAPDSGAAPAYVSPFAGYRRFDPQAPAKPWRKANEEVHEAGGHVGILKGRAAATPTPAAPEGKNAPAKDKAAAPHVHGGHR